jgi:tRNA-guanine family transglycosylase
MRLNTVHNLSYFHRLMEQARGAIEQDRYPAFSSHFRAALEPSPDDIE